MERRERRNAVTVLAPAKLNLALDVVGLLPNGYHALDMTMQTITLYERVVLRRSAGLSLQLPGSPVQPNDKNTAIKAALAFFHYTGLLAGVDIIIHKNTPVRAGMAGGSADAAAVLVGLNALYGAKLSMSELCMLPAAADFAEAQETLEEAAPESQMYEISADREQHYVLLICMKDELTEALAALRTFGFTLANLGGTPGTAKQNIDSAQQQIADVIRKREQAEADIAAFAPHRDAFKLCIDRASVRLGRAEAEERLVGTESVVCMRGWLTAPEEEKLTAVLAKYDCAWDLADPTEDEYPEVPVKLKNNKFTEPLNMVTNMYSLPAYGTVDPNPLMAPFFILFYGIMMADMGYGLVMVLAALIALGKMKPKRGSKYFCELLLACGVSTFLLGIVTGGFFGNAVPTIVKMFGHDVQLGILTSPLLDPLKDTTTILIGAMVLGFIQLVTGMIVNMVMECRQGKVGDAIFNEGTWLVLFAGLALYVLKIGNIAGVPVVLCIGGLMLLYGSGREAKGFGKVTAVFGALYNGLTGWFGDILSYSRLMALMLAGSVIAQVFNTLAAMPSSGGVTVVSMLVFILIFLVGHALNFGLNLLGCFVHDLRLQCLEFFGKFYVDGGKPFSPLEINTRYVDVENHNF